jgi:hypothetical protein
MRSTFPDKKNTCRNKKYATEEAAKLAIWAMAQNKRNSDNLMAKKCTECGTWHMVRIPRTH